MPTYYDTPPKDVDEYISWQKDDFQPTLRTLRALIREWVPEAEEMIRYHIPVFRYHYHLVGFGTTKRFCSFYPMSSDILKMVQADLSAIRISGTTLHFDPKVPLPVEVLKEIVLLRKAENEAKALRKKRD